MAATDLTCAQVEERDLESRYLAGRLTPEEAEAYEAHYFACERCWAALRRGQEAAAAFRPAPAAGRRWKRRATWPLAAAAAVILAVGLLRLEAGAPEGGAGGGTLRGRTESVVVTPGAAPGVLSASWAPVPAAARYRVRLFTADGVVISDREIPETSLVVPLESLPPAATALFWKVEALDRLRNEIATSVLRRAVLPPARPPSR